MARTHINERRELETLASSGLLEFQRKKQTAAPLGEDLVVPGGTTAQFLIKKFGYGTIDIICDTHSDENLMLDEAIIEMAAHYMKLNPGSQLNATEVSAVLSDIDPTSVSEAKEDIFDIGSYLVNVYGLGYLKEEKTADLNYLKDTIKKTRHKINTNNVKITQNDIELARLLMVMTLSKDQLTDICENEPIKTFSGRGDYVIDGNHRLLYASLLGIDSLPADKYYCTDRHFRDFITRQFSVQNVNVENILGAKDVSALQYAFVKNIAFSLCFF